MQSLIQALLSDFKNGFVPPQLVHVVASLQVAQSVIAIEHFLQSLLTVSTYVPINKY